MASELISKLPESYDKALSSGDLLFFPSTVNKHIDHGVEFEIRLCPALQNKPTLPTPHFAAPEDVPPRKQDPFAPPYTTNLFIGELQDEEGSEYVLLFNKYSVVPHHILLVTKEYRSQASPLLPPELAQIYTLLVATRQLGRRFFAFYNCGDLSGASQPHKHVQFIPLDDDGPPVERLARATNIEVEDRPFTLSALPYANHIRRLPRHLASAPPDELSATLADAFLSLLDLTISTVRHATDYPAGAPSYNFVLTLEHMHIVPRAREAHVLGATGEALSVNALGFSGLLLVKSERELEAVKEEGIAQILAGVALKSVHEKQMNESTDDQE
ncbi:HIT-like domain-containing protein [Amylocystis lapponica]|nr:HIT-like domain-containing protein [Amylocystis lapponica]